MNPPHDTPPHASARRPPLDPGFDPVSVRLPRPARHPEEKVGVEIALALEREPGRFNIWRDRAPGDPDGNAPETAAYLQRLVKLLLWMRGGATLHVAAPDALVRRIESFFAPGGPLVFDAGLMARAYERPFAVRACAPGALPEGADSGERIGGHLDGCRIGFDLGASDYKVAAVRDGEPVFSAEYRWNPVTEPDPDYHYGHLNEGLRKAAAHLPRVDAIGGSSAGIIVQNRIMVASLFRAVPADRFERDVKSLFARLQREWGVPLAVANDGDVTALAGALSLERNGILGIAMGSSEAAGYVDRQGRILGWLNELAFAPVDARPDAPKDEWSGAPGVGAQYFSQQAVNRLLPAAGIELPAAMAVPERLVEVQRLAAAGDPRAERIFATIGCYLGHTLPLYRRFYDFGDVLILGRVTSGRGGEILIDEARRVLADLYGGAEPPFRIQVPDEKSRRVGQAVAAASLPARS